MKPFEDPWIVQLQLGLAAAALGAMASVQANRQAAKAAKLQAEFDRQAAQREYEVQLAIFESRLKP